MLVTVCSQPISMRLEVSGRPLVQSAMPAGPHTGADLCPGAVTGGDRGEAPTIIAPRMPAQRRAAAPPPVPVSMRPAASNPSNNQVGPVAGRGPACHGRRPSFWIQTPSLVASDDGGFEGAKVLSAVIQSLPSMRNKEGAPKLHWSSSTCIRQPASQCCRRTPANRSWSREIRLMTQLPDLVVQRARAAATLDLSPRPLFKIPRCCPMICVRPGVSFRL